ncbi:MAG TPA: hypothetical protein VK656_03245 [Candidatus Acidoferrum sp.]|nr:hypothetical protein [Candidatus Acidoferrum sp.]
MASHPWLRWLFTPGRPSATLDPKGLDICTPEGGCHRFAWDAIARMAPTQSWLAGSFVDGWPTVELTGPDGQTLLRVPASVYGRLRPKGWRSGPRTLAEHVVVMRPDRFVFVGADRLPYFYFGLHHASSPEPPA